MVVTLTGLLINFSSDILFSITFTPLYYALVQMASIPNYNFIMILLHELPSFRLFLYFFFPPQDCSSAPSSWVDQL